MNKSKNSAKGITLVALVITIIVLVILVGVTLSVTLNTGLINNSKNAVGKYEAEQAKEETELENWDQYMTNIKNDAEMEAALKKQNLPYTIKNSYLTGIEPETTVSNFVLPDGYNLVDEGKNYVSTGMKIKKGEETVATVVIYGDTDCNGNIDINDLIPLSRYNLGIIPESYIKQAMDINHDGYINGFDCQEITNYDKSVGIEQNIPVKNTEEIILQSTIYAIQQYVKGLTATNNLYEIEWDEEKGLYKIKGNITAETTGQNIMDGLGMNEADKPQLWRYSEEEESDEPIDKTSIVQNADKIYFNETTYGWKIQELGYISM